MARPESSSLTHNVQIPSEYLIINKHTPCCPDLSELRVESRGRLTGLLVDGVALGEELLSIFLRRERREANVSMGEARGGAGAASVSFAVFIDVISGTDGRMTLGTTNGAS